MELREDRRWSVSPVAAGGQQHAPSTGQGDQLADGRGQTPGRRGGEGRLVGRLCGDGATGVFHSTAQLLTVRFVSDASVECRGFWAYYRQTRETLYALNSQCSRRTSYSYLGCNLCGPDF